MPTVCGIGYIGCSDCDTSSHSYRTWKNMLNRCYNLVCLKNNPQYKEHSVCEEWHNYANFRHWYKTHFYRCGSERMELDHNILIKGNTVCSPSAATFVPHSINIMITYERADNSGLPIGVTYRKETNRFRATCSVKNKKKEIGNYKTAEEAGKAYAEFKEKLIKETAEKYKDCISYNVYDSLMNWKV